MMILSFDGAIGAVAPPKEVVDIPWGSAPALVQEIMSKRPGVTVAEETPKHLVFKGGQFASLDVQTWRFEFTDGKFSKAVITLVTSSTKNTKGWLNDQNYAYLRGILNEKYGKPKETTHDRHRDLVWAFPDALSPGASKTIHLYFRWFVKDPYMEVTYSDIRAPESRGIGGENPKRDL